MTAILDEHAPILTKTIILRPKAPWYTDIINVNKTKHRKLERCWRRSGLTVDRLLYVEQCVFVKNLIFETKMNYYSNLITDAGPDNNAIFRIIDRLLQERLKRNFHRVNHLLSLQTNLYTSSKTK